MMGVQPTFASKAMIVVGDLDFASLPELAVQTVQ